MLKIKYDLKTQIWLIYSNTQAKCHNPLSNIKVKIVNEILNVAYIWYWYKGFLHRMTCLFLREDSYVELTPFWLQLLLRSVNASLN